MIYTSHRMITYRLRSFAGKTAALSGLLAVLLTAPAIADDMTGVAALMRSGQYAQALSKIEASLRKNPRDAQLRFMKGVILTEQNKSADAIAIFTRLTEDYPSLPEPYNNLAVLYAAGGEYEKARNALDAAIRTNPSYATAYENLGDIHAKLASQAYDKALQLDSDNSAAKSKLTLVHSLVANMGDTTTAQAAAQAPEKTASATPETAPQSQAKPQTTPQTKPQVATAPKKPEPKPVQNADLERDEVMKAVQGWANAWSERDMKAYLAHYSDAFDTPGRQTRKEWEAQRRSRIVNKGRIDVDIENPKVTLDGDAAKVKFLQIYESDSFTARTDKTLVLAKENGKWLIRQELASN